MGLLGTKLSQLMAGFDVEHEKLNIQNNIRFGLQIANWKMRNAMADVLLSLIHQWAVPWALRFP